MTPVLPPGITPGAVLTAETESGALNGLVDPSGRARVWRGIPYAAPPVGERRFAAPGPVTPWVSPRDAFVSGRAPVQGPANRPGPFKVWLGARRGRSEDCLYVDVWAPLEVDSPCAVVVWIHGGSFNSGASGDYDASTLVGEGDVVVVTVGYRLGGFGFVDFTDAVGGDDDRVASNPGLRDQIAALQWVHRNIEAFGGDPARVTIAGESAGSASVCALAVAPAARGLFHGVIAQSGALTLTIDRDDAARNARSVLDELNVSRERIDELWSRPASAVLAATMRSQARRSGGLVTRPWWDDDVLPASLADAYGDFAPVPLMIGSNADEHRTFTRLGRDIMPLTRAGLATVLVNSLGTEHAQRILATYPGDADGLNDLGSDLIFAMPSVHLAERHAPRAPVWQYRMDARSWLPGLGAFHGIELMFLFPPDRKGEWLYLGRPSERRTALATRFRAAWLRFVREGTPGDDWPAYDPPHGRSTRLWNLTDRDVDDPTAERREAWAGRDVTIH